jgi:hypothetical protein
MNEELLTSKGWTIQNLEPLELKHTDGSIASGRAAIIVAERESEDFSTDVPQILKEIQIQATNLRKTIKASEPFKFLFKERIGAKLILIQADGIGGAGLQIITGDYPIEFKSNNLAFITEDSALKFIEELKKYDLDLNLCLQESKYTKYARTKND